MQIISATRTGDTEDTATLERKERKGFRKTEERRRKHDTAWLKDRHGRPTKIATGNNRATLATGNEAQEQHEEYSTGCHSVTKAKSSSPVFRSVNS